VAHEEDAQSRSPGRVENELYPGNNLRPILDLLDDPTCMS
jgi:hypothetical protein